LVGFQTLPCQNWGRPKYWQELFFFCQKLIRWATFLHSNQLSIKIYKFALVWQGKFWNQIKQVWCVYILFTMCMILFLSVKHFILWGAILLYL
jgi:hypothetical protein